MFAIGYIYAVNGHLVKVSHLLITRGLQCFLQNDPQSESFSCRIDYLFKVAPKYKTPHFYYYQCNDFFKNRDTLSNLYKIRALLHRETTLLKWRGKHFATACSPRLEQIININSNLVNNYCFS